MHVNRLAIVLVVVLAAFSFVVFAATDPQGATGVTVQWTERNLPFFPANITAQAGNITELVINGQSQTRVWQGYVGNISGKVTLDDASNWTLYDWANTEPRGQIYATPTSTVPTWANISCFNYFVDGTNRYNLSEIEADLQVETPAVDGVNETFKYLVHPEVIVGSVRIYPNTCWTTYMYRGDLVQTSDFIEVLLTDNTSSSIIYTALLENRTPGAMNDLTGYNNKTYDFQMLVGENGNGTDVSATPYWFYLELI